MQTVKETGLEVLYFQERLCKTTQGGLKSRKVKPRKGEVFAGPKNQRCVVNLFKTYLELISSVPIYVQPSRHAKEIKFTNNPIGKIKLADYLSSMFKAARIDTCDIQAVRNFDGGRISVSNDGSLSIDISDNSATKVHKRCKSFVLFNSIILLLIGDSD